MRPGVRVAVRRVRTRPDLVALVVAAVGWVLLVLPHVVPAIAGGPAAPAPRVPDGSAVVNGARAALAGLPGWALMSAAMMVPVAIPAARHVGRNSLLRRRHRAVAAFLAAYLALWILFGAVGLSATAWWRGSSWGAALPAPLPVLAAIAVAGVWQLTPARRRQLRGCRRAIPLPPRGLRADVACARFGAVHGLRCVGSCWAIMFVMATATGAHLAWTAGLTAVMLAERRSRLLADRPQIVVGLLTAAAALVVVVGGGEATAGELAWFCRIPAAAGVPPAT